MGDDEIEIVDPSIRIGTDTYGDPILNITLVMRPTHGMSPETAEQLALKILAAAATARARAGTLRTMILDGATEEDARRLVDKYLPM